MTDRECSECYGTGFRKGWGAPCEQGCPPKLTASAFGGHPLFKTENEKKSVPLLVVETDSDLEERGKREQWNGDWTPARIAETANLSDDDEQREDECARLAALANHLELRPGEVQGVDVGTWGHSFEVPGYGEYRVLDDDEAQDEATRYILESLWAFQPYFLAAHAPKGVGEEVFTALQAGCESSNDAVLGIIGDNTDELVEDAILSDGRGHFLNTYDGEEHEAGEFYIYRVN